MQLAVTTVILAAVGGMLFSGWWMFVGGPHRATKLVDAVMTSDHGDWWAFMTNGHIEGGGRRATFGFRAASGGNLPAWACAFDDRIFIAIDKKSRSGSTGWLKEHASFRAGSGISSGVLIEVGSRTKFMPWGTSVASVVAAMRASGWEIQSEESSRPGGV